MEIINYPNYLIYSDGRVFSKYKNKFLKEQNFKDGYKIVGLCKDGKEKKFLIHRLIGIHYIPNPENKPTIDHINRDPSDNRVENLRWATQSEQNENKGIRKDNKSGHKGISFRKYSQKWVYQKRGKYKVYKSFHTKLEALVFKIFYEWKIKCCK